MPREPHGNGKIGSGRHKSAPTQPSRRNFLEESQTRSTSSAEALTSQRHTHYNGAIRTILLALKLPRLTCHDVLSGLCGAPGLLQLREKVCMQLRKELYVGCRQRWRTPAAQDTNSSLSRRQDTSSSLADDAMRVSVQSDLTSWISSASSPWTAWTWWSQSHRPPLRMTTFPFPTRFPTLPRPSTRRPVPRGCSALCRCPS